MSLKDNCKQSISFSGSATECSAEVLASHVKITCSPGDHKDGSSKINENKKNTVSYNWDLRYCPGQLVAVHVEGSVCAYCLLSGKTAMVRLVDNETNQRALIRNMQKDVKDLAFAHVRRKVILGIIDGLGTTYIFEITKSPRFDYDEIFHIIRPSVALHPVNNFRIIWCPYVPSLDEDTNGYEDCNKLDDPALTFAVINKNKVEIWDLNIARQKSVLARPGNTAGYMEIEAHTDDIVHACFSPDATAVATVGLDGYIRFFQIYNDDNDENEWNYKCVHEWKPHEDDLSCLMFLDDINNHKNEFWKFAITSAKHNSELKVWSCNDWQCLQTIQFVPNQGSRTTELLFKVSLDLTGKYLVMSEINNRLLYVLQFETNSLKNIATVSHVSEFLVSSPILSFCIVSASVKKYTYSQSVNDIVIEDEDVTDEVSNEEAVAVNMFIVQPKNFRECTVVFQPEKLKTVDYTVKTSGNSSMTELNGKTSEKEDTNEITNLNELQDSVSLLIQQQQNSQQLHLMTPDAFNSPVQNNLSPSTIRNSLENDAGGINRSVEKETDANIGSLIDFQPPQKDNFASGGSSPSREVQEILALNNPSYAAQEYFDHLDEVTNDDDNQSNFNQTDDLLFSENTEVVWPDIPIVKANEVVKEENRRLIGSTDEADNEHQTEWGKEQLQAMSYRLNTLETLVKEQNTQIQKLQHDLKDTVSLHEIFSKELDSAMSTNRVHLAKLFDNYMNVQQSREREFQESLLNGITGVVTKQLVEKLQAVIISEIKHCVLPAVLGVFENLKHQLDIQYSQKLNSTDHLLRDNIAKLVTSKSIADSLSASIVNVIKPSLDQSYKDMIAATLIPSWERICNSMFQQINDTFTKGTKEYTASVEAYMDRQRRVQDKGKDLIAQMMSVSELMKENSDKLAGSLVQEVQRQFMVSFNNMQEKLCQNISETVNEQIKQGFKNQAAVLEDSVMQAVRSRAVTPSPHIIDTQVQMAQIQQLLTKGSIEAAFQQALSASDLSLVMYVCEKVEPQQVFKNGTCILQQHVLLSLMQQLSADLAHNTEIKHSYLEESLLYLEHLPIQNEHIPIIIRDLVRQLTIFISSHPTHKYARKMKVLLLATQSLLRQ